MTDPIEEYTGDRAAADRMRQGLRAVAEAHAGSPLGHRIAEVLAGRVTMRELADDPAFVTVAYDGARRAQEQWRALSEEERAAAIAEGHRVVEAEDAERRRQ